MSTEEMHPIESAHNFPLPHEVRDALRAIIEQGKTADSQESQILDFKEDPRTASHHSKNPEAELVETILKASVCMANGNSTDSFVVLGVKDHVPGSEAIAGTSVDATWLRTKISEGTQPRLVVDIQPFEFQEKRLLLIRIPKPLEVYSRSKGESWYRDGTSCIPMPAEKRRRLEWERRNPDFTARPTQRADIPLDQGALEYARQLLTHKAIASGSHEAPETNQGILRELEVIDGENRLLYAGEILFSSSASQAVSVRHLYYPAPGVEPIVKELANPLVNVFPKTQEIIKSYAKQEIARVDLENGQEIALPTFPDKAVDEVVSNALLHREWMISMPVVIKQTPRTLTVISPGSLPPEVPHDKLLTTRSVPRNPLLMSAARKLGLAEESSRGFDRMWAAMLGSGRRPPIVEAHDYEVSVTLEAGDPDISFIQGIAKMKPTIQQSVDALIILRYLIDHPGITWKILKSEMQTNDLETREIIDWLTDENIITRTSKTIDEWALTEECASAFDIKSNGTSLSDAKTWISKQLEKGSSLNAREVSSLLHIDRLQVTRMFIQLRAEGIAMIDPDGPKRGLNTRWVARK
ncbi:MAG: putative DNA binding domain-containing protein [Actinomycetaceae bacterium]|nr:putative DNA binding domain-containing protein [Actinomycetaceae bacterium]